MAASPARQLKECHGCWPQGGARRAECRKAIAPPSSEFAHKVSSAKSNHGAPLALTNSRSLCSCLQMATFDATGAQTMITAPKYDFRPLLYLLSLGVVGAATWGSSLAPVFYCWPLHSGSD